MRNQSYYINAEGKLVEVFSSQKFDYLLRKRKVRVPELHRELVMHGYKRSLAQIYNWRRGVAEPYASELSLLALVLQCDKDDFFVDRKGVN